MYVPTFLQGKTKKGCIRTVPTLPVLVGFPKEIGACGSDLTICTVFELFFKSFLLFFLHVLNDVFFIDDMISFSLC
jgi:hypothetical protein